MRPLTLSVALLIHASLGAQEIDLEGLGHDSGAVDAPVQVIELSDFGCSFCRHFHLDTYPTLHEEYVAAGLVRWKYVTFVTGTFRHSRQASAVAECVARQGYFSLIRDLLFDRQASWTEPEDPMPVLLDLAAEVGGDPVLVGECVSTEAIAQRLEEARTFGLLSGVRGTPTFLVDGFPIMGALPIEFMRELLDRRLAAKRSENGGPG